MLQQCDARDATRTYRDRLIAEYGQPVIAVSELLGWFGVGSGEWPLRPHEPLLAGLIAEFPRSLLLAVLEACPLADAICEGIARYVSFWGVGRSRGAAADWVPAMLHAWLRATARATGVEANVARLEWALGDASG